MTGSSSARRLGVDIGGTFTDFVLVGDGRIAVSKRLSTPDDPSSAVLAGLAEMDPESHADLAHGTTVATNALLERRGARTAFVTTRGFGDLLALGRGARRELYCLEPNGTPSIVPRELCFDVEERIASDGTVAVPLSPESAIDVARRLSELRVESIAVSLLFSFLEPRHERELGRLLAENLDYPLHISLSVDVLPEFREYERSSTVAVNAYVAPLLEAYIDRLSAACGRRKLTVMGSHGGTMPPRQAARLAAATVLSGPAAGVTGAVSVAKRLGYNRVITLDMGGTSTDVALCDGAVPFTGATRVAGLPVHLPAVDIQTVGAGGGSVVAADEGGGMHVGPESAGADPGPACYGRGGRLPTLTDAHVVLGRLPAHVPLAGGLQLDAEAAQRALARVADKLGIGVAEAASGAIGVANAVMERALRRVSVERGFSPGDFALVAFGGAGPLHACELADAVRVASVIVPAAPGALSALGLATSTPTATVSQSVLKPAGKPSSTHRDVFERLEERARDLLGAQGGTSIERFADVRYAGQSWELTIPWPKQSSLADAFAAAHRKRYGYDRPGEPVEVVTLRVRLTSADSFELPDTYAPGEAGAASSERAATDGAHKGVRVVARNSLSAGDRLVGPAIVTQGDATTYIAAAWRADVSRWGDMILTRSAA